MTELTPTAVTTITAAAEYEFYGLRTLTIVSDEDEGREAPMIGSTLANSRVWDDGEITDEELDGTCAFGLHADLGESEIATAMKCFAREGYYGNYTVLIGGQQAVRGEDSGEIIIKSAMVLGVWVAL